MKATTICISQPAYRRLVKLKLRKESFSDVLLRELPEPHDTCGEVLDYLEKHGVPKSNPKLEKAMLAGRGRRSPRKLCYATQYSSVCSCSKCSRALWSSQLPFKFRP